MNGRHAEQGKVMLREPGNIRANYRARTGGAAVSTYLVVCTKVLLEHGLFESMQCRRTYHSGDLI